MKYLVTVINCAGDYISHLRFKTLKEAKTYAKTRGSHCIVEVWRIGTKKSFGS